MSEMKYYSTRDKKLNVSFREAVMSGLAPDGGLYMPVEFPKVNELILNNLEDYTFQELGVEVIYPFVKNDLAKQKLEEVIYSAFNFPVPLVKLAENEYVLELFHGPTLAFKDFAARFMARTMSFFNQGNDKELNILVATSGDTGSAVANGFYGVEGINVFILYPSGMVSEIQEKQLTTFDKNIKAIAVEGTFDDCQHLVKEAFVDKDLNAKLNLSSANSINVARLLPQSVYYFEAFKQLEDKSKPVNISIPSGNLGNLTAGIFAKKTGLPINKFISATNINSVFTDFINKGKYEPRSAVKTLSNAMDIGAPSNLERLNDIYEIIKEFREDIASFSFDDKPTLKKIEEVKKEYDYLLDPHGAIGFLAMEKYIEEKGWTDSSNILFETAHPVKFAEEIKKHISYDVEIPQRLVNDLTKKKRFTKASNRFSEFKEFLIVNS